MFGVEEKEWTIRFLSPGDHNDSNEDGEQSWTQYVSLFDAYRAIEQLRV